MDFEIPTDVRAELRALLERVEKQVDDIAAQIKKLQEAQRVMKHYESRIREMTHGL